ncbi:MAG: hypothetical protein DHS20C02_17450 [Micavibrio sp.]|nr:MAG: hypothetical protein DHS20C02_17450 [Micavibrio sp.]
MANLENVMQNNVLASLTKGASHSVVNAIKQASSRTGVNFAYLVKQAAAESNFKPEIKAKTSSATGLYQFIESTWLSMVKNHGAKHGISTEGKSRSEILEMRKDPKAASLMAAEFASENEKFLKNHTSSEIGSTELYFAHFLGAPKAASFLNGLKENPLQEAALLFPKAAAANRNVFYDRSTGRAKTMQEVYNFFDKKFDSSKDTTQMVSRPTPAHKPAQRLAKHASLFQSSDYIRSHMGGGRDLAFEILGRTGQNSTQNNYNRIPFQRMLANPVELMMLTQLDAPTRGKTHKASLS